MTETPFYFGEENRDHWVNRTCPEEIWGIRIDPRVFKAAQQHIGSNCAQPGGWVWEVAADIAYELALPVEAEIEEEAHA